MELENIARDIVNGLIPAGDQVPHDDLAFVLERLQVAVKAEREACAQVTADRDQLIATMELAWELTDCVSVAAQEGDGASIADVEHARTRQAEILAQMNALLAQVKPV